MYVLDEFKFQVREKIRIRLLTPHVYNDLAISQLSESGPILIPETLQSGCIGHDQKENSTRNLAK